MDNNSGFAQWTRNQDSQKSRGRFGGFLWWLVLFIACWWFISAWFSPKTDTVTESPNTSVVMDISNVPTAEVKSDDITATVQGLRIYDVNLLKFESSPGSDTPVSVLSAKDNFIEVGFIATGTTAPTANTVWTKTDSGYTWRAPDGVTYTRTVTNDGYVITITDTVKNLTQNNINIAPFARVIRTPDAVSTAGVYTGSVVYVNSDLEHTDWRNLDKKAYAYSTTSGFAGFTDQYWESIVSVNSPDQTIRVKNLGDGLYSADVAAAPLAVAAGETHTFTTNIFVGPRDRTVLNTVSEKIPGINETIDYGWFWFFVQPMLWALNTLNALVMNYGVAIIILTLILRFMMWPLTRKSYTSMMAMQKMQPEMARIQKLYANDKARLQMEMLRLYQTHKTSPMSGCLPMLLQIPIFFALYKALLISVQMRSAEFLWISDLAAMDPYFILPILMGLTMWWQQRLQTTAKKSDTKSSSNDVAAQTQKVMKWMPLIFTVMFAWMPAGLVLYWTVSNLFGIAQMQILRRKNNL